MGDLQMKGNNRHQSNELVMVMSELAQRTGRKKTGKRKRKGGKDNRKRGAKEGGERKEGSYAGREES